MTVALPRRYPLATPQSPLVEWRSKRARRARLCAAASEAEVGVDLSLCAHAGSSTAVLSEDEMADLAFDLGANGPILLCPCRGLLDHPLVGEAPLVAADGETAPLFGFGALRTQRATRAGGVAGHRSRCV